MVVRIFGMLLLCILSVSSVYAVELDVDDDGKIDSSFLPTVDFFLEGDPAEPELGQLWWNNSTNQLKVAGALGVYAFNATSMVAWDTTPDAFTFTDWVNATTETVYTSAPITVAGINWPAPISVSGDATAKYSINNATAVSTNGTVELGDEVRAVVTSSSSSLTAVNATVAIGGVSDAYSVTTGGSAPLTYLMDEDFEDGLAPSGWSSTSVVYNYTTSPLGGTYSARYNGGGGVYYDLNTISTSATTLSGVFSIRVGAEGEGSTPFELRINTTQVASIQFIGNNIRGNLRGTAQSYQTSSYSTATDYRVWWELDTTYNTSNSRLRVWLTAESVTSRPETPTMTVTRTETVSIPNNTYAFKAYQSDYVIDDILISESSITTVE